MLDRADGNQLDKQQEPAGAEAGWSTVDLPPGWRQLTQCAEADPHVLWFARGPVPGKSRHWIIATGDSYEEAFAAALERMHLYDASEAG